MSTPYGREPLREKIVIAVLIVILGLAIFGLYQVMLYLPQILWWLTTPLVN